MKRQEIIKDIFYKSFINNKLGVRTNIDNPSIINKIRDFYHNQLGIQSLDFINYYDDPKDTKKGNLFFIKTNSTYIPVTKDQASNSSNQIGIQTILNAYTKSVNETDAENVKIIAFLFEYKLTRKQILVIEGRRANTDAKLFINDYVKNIALSDKREDTLAKMIEILNNKQCNKVTICTNDLNFVFNILISIIMFIKNKKEFYLLFDPASMYDCFSFKLLILQKIGVKVNILPIKNKLEYYGVFPDWTPNETTLPRSILVFKTYFFESIKQNRNYSHIETNQVKIAEIFNNIKQSMKRKTEINDLSSKSLKTHEINIVQWNENKYLNYIKSKFSDSKIKKNVYENVTFSFETVSLSNIYRRTNTFTKFKLFQQIFFIDFLEKNNYIKFSKDKKTVEFYPIFLQFDSDANSPINIPFLEYNSAEKRYEIAEGHSRLWVLFHVYEVEKIKTIVVKEINEDFFKQKITYDDYSYFNIWEDTFNLAVDIDKHIEDMLVEPRNIESILHKLNIQTSISLHNKLFEELCNCQILNEHDRSFHKYLKNI